MLLGRIKQCPLTTDLARHFFVKFPICHILSHLQNHPSPNGVPSVFECRVRNLLNKTLSHQARGYRLKSLSPPHNMVRVVYKNDGVLNFKTLRVSAKKSTIRRLFNRHPDEIYNVIFIYGYVESFFQARRNGAGGGNRTHTTKRSPDFESSASTSSATPACVNGRKMRHFHKKGKPDS